MKNLLYLVLLLCFRLYANGFELEIRDLSNRDLMFKQFTEEFQNTNRLISSGNSVPPIFFSYTCKPDDTFFSVAARLNLKQSTFATLNRLVSSQEKLSGLKIHVSTVNGLFVPEKPENSIEILLRSEYSSLIESGSVPSYTIGGEKMYLIEGKDFSPATRAFFLSPKMVLPVEKKRLTSNFGMRKNPVTGNWRFHRGIDLASPEGSPVFACKSGTIKKAVKDHPIYGNYVVITHYGGKESLYAHLSEICVENNARVETGRTIGKVGSTGQATGPHLHFEISENGNPLDPEKEIR